MSTSSASTLQAEARTAARVIMGGGTILYPTETIWGVGADATNRTSVEKVYRIKRRPDHKSMLVLVPHKEMLARYMEQLPENLDALLKRSGKPTTIIYPDARNLPAELTGTDGTIGIRITTDPFCLRLLELTGVPLVSTSANLSGDPPPARFTEIGEIIRSEVDYVVNWRQEDTTPAAPSTILRLEKNGDFTVVRP